MTLKPTEDSPQISSTAPTAPTVSVLMTAYNREAYITQAIESVLASTFTDFELLIVDDGSRDNTVEVARRYEGDPRVQVLVNEKNLGDYPNRNRAAKLARGKYLKYVDSDDVIYPHGLAVMVEAMEHFPEAGLGLMCPPSFRGPYPVQLSPRQVYTEHFIRGELPLYGPLGAIIRTQSFHQTGGFSGKRFVGDTEMWLKLGARYPVVKMPDSLVWWRQHEGQEYKLGHLGQTEFSYEEWSYKIALAALTSSDCPLDARTRQAVIRRFKQGHGRILLHTALRQRQPRRMMRRMQREGFSLRDLSLAFVPKRIQVEARKEGA